MNSEEWVRRCAARLQTQWPRVPFDQLSEVAAEIQLNARRQVEEPEHAAVEWLIHAMPDPR